MADSPSIGVPAIPAPSDRGHAPLEVPSADGTVPRPAAVPGILVAADPLPAGAGAPLGDEPTGFDPAVAAALGTYVYLLVDPRTGRAFHAGVGRGDRCYRHLRAARRAVDPDTGPDPSGHRARYPRLDLIRDVESAGRRVRIDILRHGLTGAEAALVAAAVTDALGLTPVAGSVSQRRSSSEVRSLLARRAKIKRAHPMVLLRVGGPGPDPSYESARHGWRISRRWTDLGSPRSPRWAALVAGDLVVSVHRIEAWEPAAAPDPAGWTGPPAGEAFSFRGPEDAELGSRYVGRNVASYLRPGAPSPVTYVWCGPHGVDAGR